MKTAYSPVAFGLLLVAALFGLSMEGESGTPPTNVPDIKRYSYVCLENFQDLCLGISPGPRLPVYNPNDIFHLQVKSKERAEENETDFKIARWDLRYGQGKISLSKFGDLCAVKQAKTDRSMLFPCNRTWTKNYKPGRFYGRWELKIFNKNANGAAVLRLADTGMCLTPMRCGKPQPAATWCDPASSLPAWDFANRTGIYDLRRGSYLRFYPCWNTPNGIRAMRPLQVFRQRLDCSIGCTPELQDNDVCDQICNTPSCDHDNGHCGTNAPAGPTGPTTKAPTNTPTIPTPPTTKAPTTPAISKAPTTSQPTSSPTVTCPAPNILSYCSKFYTAKLCRRTAQVKRTCAFCGGTCKPKSDPRICQDFSLFNHCKPLCPAQKLKKRCEKARKASTCTRNGRLACSWCGASRSCRVGRDKRVCADPTFYDYCFGASSG